MHAHPVLQTGAPPGHFTVLLNNTAQQQAQQPLLTIGSHVRPGLQSAQRGIRTFTVGQCHSFRLQRQDVVATCGDRGWVCHPPQTPTVSSTLCWIQFMVTSSANCVTSLNANISSPDGRDNSPFSSATTMSASVSLQDLVNSWWWPRIQRLQKTIWHCNAPRAGITIQALSFLMIMPMILIKKWKLFLYITFLNSRRPAMSMVKYYFIYFSFISGISFAQTMEAMTTFNCENRSVTHSSSSLKHKKNDSLNYDGTTRTFISWEAVL